MLPANKHESVRWIHETCQAADSLFSQVSQEADGTLSSVPMSSTKELLILHKNMERLKAMASSILDDVAREVASRSLAEDLDGGRSKTITGTQFKVLIKRGSSSSVDKNMINKLAIEHNSDTFRIENYFNWSPSMRKTAYTNAPDEIKRILAEAVTTKPGKYSLKIEEVS